MPYVFPHEELFVYTIATLIMALLYMRVRIARRQRRPSVPIQGGDDATGKSAFR